jgi:hypothetical protein
MIFNQISLKPSSVARILGAVAFILVLASTAGQLTIYMIARDYHQWLVQLFYLDAEQNIPTFFSTYLLLFAALLLAVISVLERNRKASDVLYWAILSFGFLFMALDEQFAFHERLIWPVQKMFGGGHYGIFNVAWVIPGIALVSVLGLFFLRFWWRLPVKTRLTFFIAAIFYLGGCVGFEIIGGHYEALHGQRNLTYVMLATIEESLEMAGAIIFIWGLLKYIADNYQEVRIRLDGVCGDA